MTLRRPMMALATSAVMAAAGCTTPPVDPHLQTGPIVFADARDTSYGAQIRKRVNAWNELHPGQQVSMVELPEPTDDHRAQLVAHAQDARASEGGASCYDVITTDVIRTAEFASGGYIVPVDPDFFDSDAFLSEPIKSTRYGGQQWGIPLRSDVGLLYYRKDVLDAEGLSHPRTWEELRQLAMTVAPKHDLDGYLSQFDRYEGLTVNALEAIWGAGGEVIEDDGRILVDSRAAETGISRITQGFRDGWIPSDTTDYNEEHSRAAFQDGKALFLRNWTYAYRLLDAPNSPIKDDFEVAPLPTPSALGGWNLALSACSKNRRTAQEFMQFMSSEEAQRALFTNAGFAPSRRSVYADAGLLRDYPYLRVVKDSIENSRNRPVTPYYDQVTGAFQTHLHELLTRPSMLRARLHRLAGDLRAASTGR
jgi:ABC-type glycerol-3-phosphate transport system substrate-binding protein